LTLRTLLAEESPVLFACRVLRDIPAKLHAAADYCDKALKKVRCIDHLLVQWKDRRRDRSKAHLPVQLKAHHQDRLTNRRLVQWKARLPVRCSFRRRVLNSYLRRVR